MGITALVAGCHVGPKYHPPAPPAIAAKNYKESTVNFQNQPGWKVANPQAAMIRGNWWEVYNEPELNSLEDQLNINNQNIRMFFENYMAARSLIAQARSQYWPQITASPAFSRAKSSGNLVASSTANTGKTSTLWSLPLNVSWTLDFFGKIRNEVRTEQYAAQMSAADLEVEKLTEQTSLADYYFEIRGQDMLQQIVNKTVVADQKSLDAAQGAYDAGVGDYISVVQAKTTLQSAQSLAINVGLLRAQYEHAIAVLLGKVATDFTIPVKPMLYAPPPIPTGVPSELIERRPDIAAAERRLAEDNATIGVGYGAFFPAVTLGVRGGYQSSTLGKLVDWPSRFWSLGPSVTQTLFDAGLYRAQLHQYEAIYNADLANYRQTTLVAFQQVEDSISATRIYSQQVLEQQQAVRSAQQYYDLELTRYHIGVDPFVNVMIAETTLLGDQTTLNALQVNAMLASVQLVDTLGGGWDRTQLPSPKEVSAKPPKGAYTMGR